MAQSIFDYIHSTHTCVSYARDILGWPIHKSGDRALSLQPGRHHNKNLVVKDDWWCDYKTGQTGDVIDLCAITRHDGDIKAALQELAGDFYQFSTQYEPEIHRLERTFIDWHAELYRQDKFAKSKDNDDNIDNWKAYAGVESVLDYLLSRRITRQTIDRLKIGYNASAKRIMFPYYQNNRIVYWVGRVDPAYARSYELKLKDLKQVAHLSPEHQAKYEEALQAEPSKYKKMFKGADEMFRNIPWGLHTIHTRARATQGSQQLEFLFAEDFETFNKDEWLVIAEGCFDALSFEQEGWHVLSSMGGFFNPSSLRMVLSIAEQFKKVLVCFDMDGPGRKFQVNMCKQLLAHRCRFYSMDLPKKFNGQDIKDVSDYYVAGGDLKDIALGAQEGLKFLAENIESQVGFQELMMQAGSYCEKSTLYTLIDLVSEKFPKQWLKLVYEESRRVPLDPIVADRILSSHELKYIENDSFYQYEGGIWRRVAENLIRDYASQQLGRHATYAKINSASSYLKAKLSSTEDFNQQNIINFPNGVLDLGHMEFHQHDPSYMSTIQMTYAYDPGARNERFEQFVDEVLDRNDEKYLVLQEMCGYILYPDNSLQKSFFLLGDGGNGKSVLIDMLTEVYGAKNCSNVSISDFGSPFEPVRLRHSLVNFTREVRTQLKNGESMFKAIVSGDVISAAYKGKDSLEFRPRCKIICACNDFVTTNDLTHAFLRRLYFINFKHNFVQRGEANPKLTEELKAGGLSGIFNWCLVGYQRLRRQGGFTQTQEDKELRGEFLESVNPLALFVNECLMTIQDEEYSPLQLYTLYKTWCQESGSGVLSRNRFSRMVKILLRSQRPEVVIRKVHNQDYIEFPRG